MAKQPEELSPEEREILGVVMTKVFSRFWESDVLDGLPKSLFKDIIHEVSLLMADVIMEVKEMEKTDETAR